MAQLIVRNLDEDIIRRLKKRAAEHGRSMEAEHRNILQAALELEPATEQYSDFKAALLAMPDVGIDEDFQRHQDYGRDIELSA